MNNIIETVKDYLVENGPRMMVIGGTVGLAGAGVYACAKTAKLDAVKAKNLERIENLPEGANKFPVIVKNAGNILKHYAIPISIGVASAAMIVVGNDIECRRNKALTAACGALGATLTAYRGRVRNEVGEEREDELFRGINCTKKVTTVNPDTGEVETHEEQLTENEKNIYCWEFAYDTTEEWDDRDVEYNANFIRLQEKLANALLQRRGKHGKVFLNEVLRDLGFDVTHFDEGQVVGWKADGSKSGDGYISFGMKPIMNIDVDGNSYVDHFSLEFNCDGVIVG